MKRMAAPSVLARRAATASVIPQVAIAIAFFLPAVRVCDQVESPASVAVENELGVVLIAPPFAAALLMAVVTVAGRARRRPPGAAALIAPCMLGPYIATIALACLGLGASSTAPWFLMWAILGIACGVTGLRRRSWVRWVWFITGHVVVITPIAAAFIAELLEHGDYPGTYLFLLAYALLVVIQLAWIAVGRIGAYRRKAQRALVERSLAESPFR
jgi:hypothetical protein